MVYAGLPQARPLGASSGATLDALNGRSTCRLHSDLYPKNILILALPNKYLQAAISEGGMGTLKEDGFILI